LPTNVVGTYSPFPLVASRSEDSASETCVECDVVPSVYPEVRNGDLRPLSEDLDGQNYYEYESTLRTDIGQKKILKRRGKNPTLFWGFGYRGRCY
jgi:hypothetical protein